MQTTKLRQHTAIFGQFVTYLKSQEVGYDLAIKNCLFLAFQCLLPWHTYKEKALQIIEFVGLVLLLSPLILASQRRDRDCISF